MFRTHFVVTGWEMRDPGVRRLVTVEDMHRPALTEALRDREAVLRAFVSEDGSLRSMPTKIRKRLVVLDLVAQDFAVGETYDETAVNNLLRPRHPDVAALRRSEGRSPRLRRPSALSRAEVPDFGATGGVEGRSPRLRHVSGRGLPGTVDGP